jgi:hypothetical protein
MSKWRRQELKKGTLFVIENVEREKRGEYLYNRKQPRQWLNFFNGSQLADRKGGNECLEREVRCVFIQSCGDREGEIDRKGIEGERSRLREKRGREREIKKEKERESVCDSKTRLKKDIRDISRVKGQEEREMEIGKGRERERECVIG